MFFKNTREKMRTNMVKQNDAFLNESLIPGEEIKKKLISKMPHGQISRNILAITNKRLIIISVDKASQPHVTSLRFKDVLEVRNYKGGLKGLSINFITANKEIPTGIFENESCREFLNILEAKRLE